MIPFWQWTLPVRVSWRVMAFVHVPTWRFETTVRA